MTIEESLTTGKNIMKICKIRKNMEKLRLKKEMKSKQIFLGKFFLVRYRIR